MVCLKPRETNLTWCFDSCKKDANSSEFSHAVYFCWNLWRLKSKIREVKGQNEMIREPGNPTWFKDIRKCLHLQVKFPPKMALSMLKSNFWDHFYSAHVAQVWHKRCFFRSRGEQRRLPWFTLGRDVWARQYFWSLNHESIIFEHFWSIKNLSHKEAKVCPTIAISIHLATFKDDLWSCWTFMYCLSADLLSHKKIK